VIHVVFLIYLNDGFLLLIHPSAKNGIAVLRQQIGAGQQSKYQSYNPFFRHKAQENQNYKKCG
jgi:hypothetical protein